MLGPVLPSLLRVHNAPQLRVRLALSPQLYPSRGGFRANVCSHAPSKRSAAAGRVRDTSFARCMHTRTATFLPRSSLSIDPCAEEHGVTKTFEFVEEPGASLVLSGRAQNLYGTGCPAGGFRLPARGASTADPPAHPVVQFSDEPREHGKGLRGTGVVCILAHEGRVPTTG